MLQPFVHSIVECPFCKTAASNGQCCETARELQKKVQPPGAWVSFTRLDDPINQHTDQAYQVYSKNYAITALLAYWIVWRGKLRHHIRFYRSALMSGNEIVDIATGEGSLTALAFWKGKKKPQSLIALDLSVSMLKKATHKFKGKPVQLIQGDVQQLPMQAGSVPVLTCFGGLNSFPSIPVALSEFKRVVKPSGDIFGSVLLFPESEWRRKLIREWIQKGYQTISPSRAEFEALVAQSGLKIKKLQQVGDVLLFNLMP